MSQKCWEEPGLLTDHLPLLHSNFREKSVGLEQNLGEGPDLFLGRI